jgi:hypothetical protein|tara:strand:- start:16889 stop:17530 length:642 start_codon:yes stop_codon:yes gene_type:complete
VNLLPGVSPDLFLSNNLAIVGSSGNLLSNNHGEKIDEFDEVIRFNRAPTYGYENKVGSKTTLRVINNHVFNNNDISSEGYTNQPKDFVRNLRDTRILYFASDLAPWNSRVANTHQSNKLFLYDYSNTESIKTYFGYPDDKFPTLGVGIIFLSVIMGSKPVLFGFDDINNTEQACTRSHYWEERPDSQDTYHGISFEKLLISKLADQNFVQIYK